MFEMRFLATHGPNYQPDDGCHIRRADHTNYCGLDEEAKFETTTMQAFCDELGRATGQEVTLFDDCVPEELVCVLCSSRFVAEQTYTQ